jgi:hypothetical protein
MLALFGNLLIPDPYATPLKRPTLTKHVTRASSLTLFEPAVFQPGISLAISCLPVRLRSLVSLLALIFADSLHQFVNQPLGRTVEAGVQVAPSLRVAPQVIAGFRVNDGYVRVTDRHRRRIT